MLSPLFTLTLGLPYSFLFFPFLKGFEVTLDGPYGEEGCDDTNAKDDTDDEDDNKENTPPDSQQQNPWKLARDEIMLYDDIFPGAATSGNTKSDKNKVINYLQHYSVSMNSYSWY